MPPLRRALDRLYGCGALLGGLCLIGIVALVIAQVLGRWLGLPLAGMTELSGYAMANGLLLPMGYAFRQGAHIRITLLIDRLSGGWRWTGEVICLAFGFGLAGYFAYHMAHMAHISYIIHEVSQGADATPLWIPQMGMAIGAAILSLSILDRFITHALSYRQPSRSSQAVFVK